MVVSLSWSGGGFRHAVRHLVAAPLALLIGVGVAAVVWPVLSPQTAVRSGSTQTAEAEGVVTGAPVAESVDPGAYAPDPTAQQILGEFVASSPTPKSVVVFDLTRQREAMVAPDRIYTAASLYKLFVAERLYELRAAGRLLFDRKITITQAAADEDAGTLIWSVGSRVSVADCMRRMITVSDNTCGYLLVSMVGWSKSDPALHSLGYTKTSLATSPQTTARDVARLLANVAERKMVNAESSTELEQLLWGQTINTRLPVDLPPGVIGHKTGDLGGLAHDAGIVRAGTNYVIAVLSGPWSAPTEADPAISGLSAQIYSEMLLPSGR